MCCSPLSYLSISRKWSKIAHPKRNKRSHSLEWNQQICALFQKSAGKTPLNPLWSTKKFKCLQAKGTQTQNTHTTDTRSAKTHKHTPHPTHTPWPSVWIRGVRAPLEAALFSLHVSPSLQLLACLRQGGAVYPNLLRTHTHTHTQGGY